MTKMKEEKEGKKEREDGKGKKKQNGGLANHARTCSIRIPKTIN